MQHLLYEDFLDSEGLPVAIRDGNLQPGSPNPENDEETRKEINSDLAEVTSTSYSWPLAGYEAICETLEEHGIELPVDISGEDSSDELVFALKDHSDDNLAEPSKNQLYIYICYVENDEGKFEFYAEIVNEPELHDVLDKFNMADANDNDDDNDEEDSGDY